MKSDPTFIESNIKWRERQNRIRQDWEENEQQKDRRANFWQGLMAIYIASVWGIILPIIVYQILKIQKP